MFLHLSVSHPVHRGVYISACIGADTPSGRHPLGRHPSAQCMLGHTHTHTLLPSACWITNTPLPSVCWDTPPPPAATTTYGTHPTRIHSFQLNSINIEKLSMYNVSNFSWKVGYLISSFMSKSALFIDTNSHFSCKVILSKDNVTFIHYIHLIK